MKEPTMETTNATRASHTEAPALPAPRPLTGDFAADAAAFTGHWWRAESEINRLPAKPKRSEDDARRAAAIFEAARSARIAFLDTHVETIYRKLTGNLSRYVRLEDLVFEAAALVPGLVPSREELAREAALKQADKDGIELDQGLFVARLMRHEALAEHLCHAMMLPLPGSLDRLAAFQRTGKADCGKAMVERRGAVSTVTMRNPEALNAEDGTTLVPLETAVDLALLDPATKICVLRGGPIPHAKYAGRRAFGAGINLTHLYWGKVPYLFYLVRDLGMLNKIYRGITRPQDPPDETLGFGTEKLWIAAVEEFAIGGHCQILLVMDYVLAAKGAYLTLPARKEGIIPGMANMRLPRFVGDRLTRQAIMYEKRIECDSPEGRLICDEIVPAAEMDAALQRVADGLTNSGVVNAAANRRAFRIVDEPLATMIRYLSVYAREQAYCHTSPALVANLERYWNAHERKVKA
jgi:(3,5-dihydroxyphenyl)acetyl-CoA 1,2-dioxygenase